MKLFANFAAVKNKVMAVYQIRINEKMMQGKSLVSYLQSIPEIVTFEIPKKEKWASKSEIYHDLNHAFADVRLLMDGKKKEKTLQELINELPDSGD